LVRNWPWQPIFVIEGLTIQLLETPFYAWSCFQTVKKKKNLPVASCSQNGGTQGNFGKRKNQNKTRCAIHNGPAINLISTIEIV
jgi:hypothetical protein